MNNTPVGMLGLGPAGTTAMVAPGGGTAISLTSIVSDPGTSLDAMQTNFMANYQGMAVSAIGIGITMKFARKLLRAPISNVNRHLMKPLGIGVRL